MPLSSVEKVEQIRKLKRLFNDHSDIILSNHDKLQNIKIRISFGNASNLLIILSEKKKELNN